VCGERIRERLAKPREQGVGQLRDGLDRASGKDFPLAGQPAGLSGDDLVGFWRDTWRDFAEALRAWPEIREAAAAL